VAAGGGGGAPWLARVTYAPASLVAYTVTAALAALDTTNLTIGFTVPASGNVVLEAYIAVNCRPAATPNNYVSMYLTFVTHSTLTVVSPYQLELSNYAPSASPLDTIEPVVYQGLVTGLTPGAALAYDLAGIYTNSGTPILAQYQAGNGTTTALAGPANLFVYPA
jgi:hypothetical protein